MQSRSVLLLCVLLTGFAAASHGQGGLVLSGYVTRAASASDFDVNGIRILCREKAQSVSKPARGATEATADCPADSPYVGQFLAIHYSVEGTSIKALYATRIQKQRPQSFGEISGSAVISAAEEAKGIQPPGLLVHADGFRIRITGKTKIEWTPPLQSLADVKAGEWIKYKGKLDATGVLAAASAQIRPYVVETREERLLKKHEYDPSAVSANAKQNFLKDGFAGGCRGSMLMGCDPKKFPPFEDAAMQARIEKIGKHLIPLYQLNLPDSDPVKIDFRFQLIDTRLFRDVLSLPSGIILIPHQVVERLQNDSQIAAVLAYGMACALERQEYRSDGKIKAAYASGVASAFVPYAGLGMVAGGTVASRIETKEMQQRDRVSLALMRNAGYDMDQAPLAWWLLAPKKPQPIPQIEMPDRVTYLYRILGAIWRYPIASAGPGSQLGSVR